MLSSLYNPNHQPLDPRCEALDVLPVFGGLDRGSSFDHLLECQLSAALVKIFSLTSGLSYHHQRKQTCMDWLDSRRPSCNIPLDGLQASPPWCRFPYGI